MSERNEREKTIRSDKNSHLIKEVVSLAEQAARDGMKAVPGKKWGLHYPKNQLSVQDTLQGLLDGKLQPDKVAPNLKPDAIVFDIKDIETQGVEAVSARISEISLYYQHMDYQQYAEFVASMHGKNIPLHELQTTYDGMVRARVQKRLYDSFGSGGQRRMKEAFGEELEHIESNFGQLSSVDRVLAALKQNWLANGMGFSDPNNRNILEKLLNEQEHLLYDQIKESFINYAQTGDENAYQQIVKTIASQFPKIIPPPIESRQQPSQAGQELAEELKQLDHQPGPPGSQDDPAIPPEDSDEYHTQPPNDSGASSQEKGGSSRVYFEIKPPLGGYYVQGRKSYYDVDRKVWSKQKKLTPYSTSLSAVSANRHQISGYISSSITALPLPKTFAIDSSTIQSSNGSTISVFRDQNGCFYLKADKPTHFSVDFLKEPNQFPEGIISEDVSPMYRGSLSTATENFIQSVSGDAVQKARHIRAYIHSHHFYPGGGDLTMAQGLQYKLRKESTGDTYIQNLDTSEYLECYSANTLFCAMLRKVGVPARLVVGDRVQGGKNGKSAITDQTGHAWSEIWDGKQWVRFDATPAAKPEDKKQNQNKDEQNQSAEEAQDGAADEASPPQSDQNNQEQQSQNSSQNVSDQELQDGQKQLENAQNQLDEMRQKQSELKDKISEADSFDDIKKLREEIEKQDLLEEMEQSLDDSLEAKLEELKDEVKDKLQQMVDDGFLEQEMMDRLLEEMEEATESSLKEIEEEIERESKLYDAYEALREAVQPYVDEWWEYFADRLPKEQQIDLDDDSLTRSGALNRRSVQRFRNLMFGRVKNPRKFDDSVKPRFLATVMIDTSGSMSGEKLRQAMLLLVFYNELFSRISSEYGYIRYANYTFSDSVREIKTFDQDYNSPNRYKHADGSSSTIKVRLMKAITASGGTNMLDGVRKAGADLNKQVAEYPDFLSALYFIGDGGDTCGNAQRIKDYLHNTDSEKGGFGKHLLSAIMLGGEDLKTQLAAIFGNEATSVATNFDQLIEKSMLKLEEDIIGYLSKFQ